MKSKLGCQICRRRHIKCDEQRPGWYYSRNSQCCLDGHVRKVQANLAVVNDALKSTGNVSIRPRIRYLNGRRKVFRIQSQLCRVLAKTGLSRGLLEAFLPANWQSVRRNGRGEQLGVNRTMQRVRKLRMPMTTAFKLQRRKIKVLRYYAGGTCYKIRSTRFQKPDY